MIRLLLLAAALCCPLRALAAGAPPTPKGRAVERGDEAVEEQRYRSDLEQLRDLLQKHDEDPAFVNRFIDDLETRFRGPASERVPVTSGTFSLFLRYEKAWARKTRDAKNPQVQPEELQHEEQLAEGLRLTFNRQAEHTSPRFFAAFRAAVHDVRATAGSNGQVYSGSSQVFFSDQINDTYTKLDAADEALERGDTKAAKRLADQAVAQSPSNADGYVMRAGAEYAAGNGAAAAQDAQQALQLDPANPQASAIMELSGHGAAAAPVLTQAAAQGAALGADGAAPASPEAVQAGAGSLPVPAALPALSSLLAAPPSRTPALAMRLSSDLTQRAAQTAQSDPLGSTGQLDRAIGLDPRNVQALDWRAYVANKQGDYRDALAAADAALAVDPRDARAHYNRADALAGDDDRAGALEALRQAADIDPRYQPLLHAALQLPQDGDMALLFKNDPSAFQPHAAPGLIDRLLHAPTEVLLGAIALLLVLLGLSQAALAFRS